MCLKWEVCTFGNFLRLHTMGVNNFTGVNVSEMKCLLSRIGSDSFTLSVWIFLTGVNASVLRSLHFHKLGLTISHWGWEFIHCCKWFWLIESDVFTMGCEFIQSSEWLWIEMSVFLWNYEICLMVSVKDRASSAWCLLI